jgi:p-cumate 2,3-dioxygenase ferredoxin reductase subunit
MLGHPDGYAGVPWFWSDQYATNLQVAGSLAGVEEIVRGDVAGGRFSIVGLRDGEIVGAATVNSPKEMAILRRAVAAHARSDRGDLEDPKFELKRLLQK